MGPIFGGIKQYKFMYIVILRDLEICLDIGNWEFMENMVILRDFTKLVSLW